MNIEFNGEEIVIDEEFSYRDYVNQSVEIPDGTTVYMSCFAQEYEVYSEPDEEGNVTLISNDLKTPFREDMKNVKFLNCNMTGCFVPAGNTVINI
jgi:hypothetical protein